MFLLNAVIKLVKTLPLVGIPILLTVYAAYFPDSQVRSIIVNSYTDALGFLSAAGDGGATISTFKNYTKDLPVIGGPIAKWCDWTVDRPDNVKLWYGQLLAIGIPIVSQRKAWSIITPLVAYSLYKNHDSFHQFVVTVVVSVYFVFGLQPVGNKKLAIYAIYALVLIYNFTGSANIIVSGT